MDHYIFNTSLSFGRARLAIPTAALLYASFLGLLLFTVFLGESRNSERKADGEGDNGNNGFHGAFPLRIWGLTQVVSARITSGKSSNALPAASIRSSRSGGTQTTICVVGMFTENLGMIRSPRLFTHFPGPRSICPSAAASAPRTPATPHAPSCRGLLSVEKKD